MSTLIAWGNIHQHYPFKQLPQSWQDWLAKQERGSTNSASQHRNLARKVGYFLLYKLLQQQQLFTYFTFSFNSTEKGRPFFVVPNGTKHKVDFNLSHSGDWVAIGVSIDQEVTSLIGIDIEQPRKVRDFARLLQYYASENEINWWRQQSEPQQAFYQSWCCREAILKASGVGLVALAEVEFMAKDNHFIATSCPEGQVFFSSNLPFYLAYFSQQNTVNYFEWNGEQLMPNMNLIAKGFTLISREKHLKLPLDV